MRAPADILNKEKQSYNTPASQSSPSAYQETTSPDLANLNSEQYASLPQALSATANLSTLMKQISNPKSTPTEKALKAIVRKYGIQFAEKIIERIATFDFYRHSDLELLNHIYQVGDYGLTEFVECFPQLLKYNADHPSKRIAIFNLLKFGFANAYYFIRAIDFYKYSDKTKFKNLLPKYLYHGLFSHIVNAYESFGTAGAYNLFTFMPCLFHLLTYRSVNKNSLVDLIVNVCAYVNVNGFKGIEDWYDQIGKAIPIFQSEFCSLKSNGNFHAGAKIVEERIIANDEVFLKNNALSIISQEYYKELLELIKKYKKEVAEEYVESERKYYNENEVLFIWNDINPTLKSCKLSFLLSLKDFITYKIFADDFPVNPYGPDWRPSNRRTYGENRINYEIYIDKIIRLAFMDIHSLGHQLNPRNGIMSNRIDQFIEKIKRPGPVTLLPVIKLQPMITAAELTQKIPKTTEYVPPLSPPGSMSTVVTVNNAASANRLEVECSHQFSTAVQVNNNEDKAASKLLREAAGLNPFIQTSSSERNSSAEDSKEGQEMEELPSMPNLVT